MANFSLKIWVGVGEAILTQQIFNWTSLIETYIYSLYLRFMLFLFLPFLSLNLLTMQFGSGVSYQGIQYNVSIAFSTIHFSTNITTHKQLTQNSTVARINHACFHLGILHFFWCFDCLYNFLLFFFNYNSLHKQSLIKYIEEHKTQLKMFLNYFWINNIQLQL